MPVPFGVFATCRAGDQLRNGIAYPKANVKLGITHCGLSVGGDGASHQSNEDMAIVRSFPNLTLLVPGDYEEAKLATKAAAYMKGPVYLRLGRDKYPVVPEIHGSFEIGKAKLLHEGTDLTIISTGIMISEALQAQQLLTERRCFYPIDPHAHGKTPGSRSSSGKRLKETAGIVTVEEHSIIGGLGEAVAGVTAETNPCPVQRVGIQDVFGESGMAPDLFDKYGLRAVNIVEAANRILDRVRTKT